MLIFRIFEYLFRRRHSNTTATTATTKNRDTRTETIIAVVLDDCVEVLIFTGTAREVGASDEEREEGVDTEIAGCVEGFFVRLVVDFAAGLVVGIYLKKVQYIKLFK